MVYRENPKCDLCGEDIPGVYNENPDLIGDTFSYWDYKSHQKVCKEQTTGSNMKTYAVTGTFHGSIVEAPNEGAARRAFHKFYNGESILCIKILNIIP